MMWLWVIGPAVFLLVLFVLTLGETNEEKRRTAELERWVDELMGPIKRGKKTRSRRVRALPAALNRAVEQTGGGARVADLVLVPKYAYMAVRAADGLTVGGHQTVVCALAKKAPSFLCRPLPILDGRPLENRGVFFSKDPEFMESFVIEGADGRAIFKWLKPSLREALGELGEVWLRVEGRVMSLTLYGPANAEQLDALVDVADAFFAAKGADGGASLFGEGKKTPLHGPFPKAAETETKSPSKQEPEAVVAPPPLRLQAGVVDMALYTLAGVLVAMVLGRFAAFHPEVLFNNPDPVITEPWQGGWTTRGMGAFIAVESFLVGLFALQTYLGAAGKSVGKILFGLRVVREKDLGEVSFFRGVLIRSWLFGLAPIIAAAVVTRPFDVRSFLANIPGKVPLLVAAGMVCVAGLVVAIAKGGRGVHDLLAGTRVIRAEPWRVRKVQLGLKTAFDRVVLWQAGRVLVLVLCALIVIAVAVRENWTVAPF